MVRQIKCAYSRLTNQDVGTEVLIDFLVDKYKDFNQDEESLFDTLATKYNKEVANAVCKKVMCSTELSLGDSEPSELTFVDLYESATGSAQDYITKMLGMYYEPETDPEEIDIDVLLNRAPEDVQLEYYNYLKNHQSTKDMKHIFWEAYDYAKGNGETYDDGVVDTILQLIKEGYLNKEEWEEPDPLY